MMCDYVDSSIQFIFIKVPINTKISSYKKKQNIETQITKDNKQETYETSKTKKSTLSLTLMEPCIASVFLSTMNEMQRYTMFFTQFRLNQASGNITQVWQVPMLHIQFLSSWWWAEKN
jgi:hypothetical protein